MYYRDAEIGTFATMKEWKLRFLILFSLISITGLILIQTYWIRDAIQVKESHFKQSVNQAVARAVWRLERLAMVSAKEQHLQEGGNVRQIFDTAGKGIYYDTVPLPSYLSQPTDSVMPVSKGLPSLGWMTDSLLTELNSGDESLAAFRDDLKQLQMRTTPDFRTALDSVLESIGRISSEIEVFNNTKTQLEEEIKQLTEGDPGKIKSRFTDSALIGELLAEELGNEGLKLHFYYGLYFPFSGTHLYSHTDEITESLRHSGFVYSLFPSLSLSKPIYLVVVFPGDTQYLFAKQGYIMTVSFILILILILAFFYITGSIYRQKKIGEMKNDFINNMTHEFKTPVSTISLACEALRDKDIVKPAEVYDNYLQIIDNENRRLGKMAERILQTAIIDKGHLYLYFEPVDMHELIQQVLSKYQPLVDQRSGTIHTKFLAADSVITGDRTHLHNMISNLVDNSIKYSREIPEIKILTHDKGDQFFISVQDSGIGISKANQKRIFDKLFRVSTGNLHNVKGFGLGLSYVKYILDRHSGTIRVESELQKGSAFRITLPRHPVPQKSK